MMATAPEFREFHALPADEPDHVVDGGDCPCEPQCLLAGELFRVFIHSQGVIKFVVRRHKLAPKWWVAK